MRKISNKQKALLHVAKAKLGMSDMEYLAMLDRVGCQSSRDLTQGKFKVILKHLETLGFVPKTKFKAPCAKSKELLTGKINAILNDLGYPWGYVEKMVKTMFGLDAVRFCTAQQLHKVVAALTYHQRRRNGYSA